MMRIYLVFLLAILFSFPLDAQMSMNVNLVGNWQDSTINEYAGRRHNEVWGFVQDGREYGVIGSTEGVHIIDLADPANPVEVDFIDGVTDEAIHRDMHDHEGYLYMVCDQGQSRLKIADLSYLPDSVHLVYDSDEYVARVHNIFIDSTSGWLYCYGASDTLFNLIEQVVILEFDPITETVSKLGAFDAGNPNIQSHDGYVLGDTGFVNMLNDGLYMLDFTNPASPAVIGQFPFYSGTITNHSGWMDHDRDLYVMADEAPGTRIKVMDVADPSNISIVHEFAPATSNLVIPHNPMLKGRFMFLSANTDGLRIFDLFDPQNPVLTGFYDTYAGPDSDGFKGAWGVYSQLPSGLILVSDRNEGFYVFEVDAALGTAETSNTQLEVWPVPVRDRVKLTWSAGEFQAVELRVSTIDGKNVGKWPLEAFVGEYELDFAGMPSGMYLLELLGEGGERTVAKVLRE